MEYPSLEFFRQVIHPEISRFSRRTIKTSAPPARVERVMLYLNGHRAANYRLIAKVISPGWQDDPQGEDRERIFYQSVFPRLGFEHPRVHHVSIYPDTGQRLILMEDVSGRYRFPPPTHRWELAEVFSFLRTYAYLHTRGQELLPALDDRDWLLAYHLQPLDCAGIEAAARYLVRLGIWDPMPNLESLIRRTQDQLAVTYTDPATLIHNDLYPPNIGLPRDLAEPAVLVDWDMAAWGPAELDLAYLFTQPFRSAEGLHRQTVLDYYWEQRLALEGCIPSCDERQCRQDFADSVFALTELLVAEKVARNPFLPGSAPQIYWQAMFPVLRQRLVELSERF